MKTLEALYQEILADTELQLSFGSAMKENRMEEFLKENGCEASKEEAEAFLKEKLEKQGELADEELDSVAGGGCGHRQRTCPVLGCGSTNISFEPVSGVYMPNQDSYLVYFHCHACGHEWMGNVRDTEL